TGSQVLPAFVEGANSRLFYAAGRVHPLLRTLLLIREMLNKRGRMIAVRFADPIDPRAGTGLIRGAVERLRSNGRTDEIASEIAALPESCRLLESGAFDVFCAGAHQIRSALREIGRLREIAYSAVGEGTGRELDLDEFDETYSHLFVWDRRDRQIVGAYRF